MPAGTHLYLRHGWATAPLGVLDVSHPLNTLAASGTCGTAGTARLSQAESGRPRPAGPRTGCSPTGCHQLSLPPEPVPHSATAGPETVLSTSRLWGSLPQGWGARRVVAPSTSCSVSSVLATTAGSRAGGGSPTSPGNGWEQPPARSAVGAQGACAEQPEISSGRAEPLSRDGKHHSRPNPCPLWGEPGELPKGQELTLGLSVSLPRLSVTLKMAFEAAQLLPKEPAVHSTQDGADAVSVCRWTLSMPPWALSVCTEVAREMSTEPSGQDTQLGAVVTAQQTQGTTRRARQSRSTRTRTQGWAGTTHGLRARRGLSPPGSHRR